MRWFIYVFLTLIVWWTIAFGLYEYNQTRDGDLNKSSIVISDLKKAKDILSKVSWLPNPWGNIIYYNNSWSVTSWWKYDISTGWLCSKDFSKLWINMKDPFTDKCYKYTVTKDLKKFQLWWVIKTSNWYETILTWNIDYSITKDCFADVLLENKTTKWFPYNPYTKYVTAKIIDLKLDKNWAMRVLDNEWKKHTITSSSFKDFVIKPYDTILLKWTDSVAYLKFENQDVLKLEWWTIIKIKQDEISQNNSTESFFWLVGRVVYTVYDKAKEKTISTPVSAITIRWDILNGEALIEDKNYKLETKQESTLDSSYKKNSNSYILKNSVDTKLLFDSSDLWADVLWYKFDVEKLVQLEKN